MGSNPIASVMVRKKKVSGSGAKNDDGSYNNGRVNLNKDELEFAGIEIGDHVHVYAEEDRIIIKRIGE